MSTNGEPQSPELHFGWTKAIGTDPPGLPVNLRAKGLKAHTAIVAQSGSGKSFALGRLLEEIALKTKGRVLILDPNSDFIKFSETAENIWKEKRFTDWLADQDTKEEFTRRTGEASMVVLTNRNEADLKLTNSQVSVSPISIRWGDFTLLAKAAYLGFSASESAAELYALFIVELIAKHNQKREGKPESSYTYRQFYDCAGRLWDETTNAAPTAPSIKIPDIEIGGLKPDVVQKVHIRIFEFRNLPIWSEEDDQPLTDYMEGLCAPDSGKKVAILDLASLREPDARLSAVGAALRSLRRATEDQWGEALKKDSKCDRRSPIFIAIDEAHTLAPAEPTGARAKVVLDELISIAAEGRKYGLFLILVTQRPSRLHPSILSQCDNLCLMKMNNRADLALVEESFGFVPKGMPELALRFELGECLLAGSFVEQPVVAHVAPRRTVEGGRNIRDKSWLQDPAPPPEEAGESDEETT